MTPGEPRGTWPWLPWLTTALATAGLAVAGYLTAAHYTSPQTLACPDTGFVNCAKVTTSPQSVVFGVPVAVVGVAYFAVVVVASLPPMWRSSRTWVALGRLGLVAGAMAFVVYLVGMELLVLGVICLWCTVVHVIQFAIFLSVTAGTAARWPEIKSHSRN